MKTKINTKICRLTYEKHGNNFSSISSAYLPRFFTQSLAFSPNYFFLRALTTSGWAVSLLDHINFARDSFRDRCSPLGEFLKEFIPTGIKSSTSVSKWGQKITEPFYLIYLSQNFPYWGVKLHISYEFF